MSAPTTRSSADGESTGLTSRRVVRLVGITAAVVFWGWLLVRWAIDWGLGSLVGIARDTPLIAPSSVASISGGLAFAVGFLPEVADAVWLTIVLTVISIVLGFLIAVPLAVTRVYGTRTATVSLLFTEVLRGTPLLAQLFVLYYALNLSQYFRGLPADGFLPSPAVYVAIIGFTINSAAYQAEYIRSAMLSVAGDQLTAARAIGLPKLQAIRYVVLPQALRFAIPGWSNELVYLIKYSSLAAFITVPELFNVAGSIAAQNFQYTRVFSLVALLYLGLVISAAKLMSVVEQRTRIPGLGGSTDR